MTNNIRRCPTCSSYGLSEECPCGSKRTNSRPAKFSPEDHYGKYRRAAKKDQVVN